MRTYACQANKQPIEQIRLEDNLAHVYKIKIEVICENVCYMQGL